MSAVHLIYQTGVRCGEKKPHKTSSKIEETTCGKCRLLLDYEAARIRAEIEHYHRCPQCRRKIFCAAEGCQIEWPDSTCADCVTMMRHNYI